MRRLVLVVLLVAAALAAAVPSAAKDGVTADLLTKVDLGARPGTRMKVAWSLGYVDGDGPRRPFGAGSVFVRLLSASGAPAQTVFARTDADADGRFEATVVVPDGGIADIEIGLRGYVSHTKGPSDLLFPITNDPLPGPARIRVSAPVRRQPTAPPVERGPVGVTRAQGSGFSSAALPAALLAACALGVVLARRWRALES